MGHACVGTQDRDLLVLLAQLTPEAVDHTVDLAHPVAAQADIEDEVVEVRVGDRLVGKRLVGQQLGAGRIDERLMAPTAADWITLAEASEILEAANVRFRPETIGGWARAGKLQSIKLGGRRFVRRGEVKALVAGPRRVRADDLQPALFEELQR